MDNRPGEEPQDEHDKRGVNQHQSARPVAIRGTARALRQTINHHRCANGRWQKSIAIVGGASIIGGIFFTLVFLGSMAIIKDTSQGPLVGIFIATPLGVILGAIVGYQYATSKI